MTVAMRLAHWRDQPPGQWFNAASRYLVPVVTGVLVIVIARQLATLTWTVAPGSMPVAAALLRAATSDPGPTADYGALTQSHLFGEPAERAEAVAVPVADAPDTTLSLTLTGILSKQGDPNGSAGIKNSRNEERPYYVGQSIDGADGATLHSVYADRVLLSRNGRLETLRLPSELSAANGQPTRIVSPLTPAQPSADPLRDVISRNAARLNEIIRPSPHLEQGQIIGVRLNPGRDRATFEALGFQSGDVVTDINGTVLNDGSQALQIFEALGESTQANVTVLRDGVPQVLVIDTTQLQGLQENRE